MPAAEWTLYALVGRLALSAGPSLLAFKINCKIQTLWKHCYHASMSLLSQGAGTRDHEPFSPVCKFLVRTPLLACQCHLEPDSVRVVPFSFVVCHIPE